MGRFAMVGVSNGRGLSRSPCDQLPDEDQEQDDAASQGGPGAPADLPILMVAEPPANPDASDNQEHGQGCCLGIHGLLLLVLEYGINQRIPALS